jgi:DNA-nicking Smr family endonuclease
VDLHGLHIAEVTEQVLPYALEQYSDRALVRVVTGTGHHSKGSGTAAGGMGRLEAAVRDWLEANGVAFRILRDSNGQGGQFLVETGGG